MAASPAYRTIDEYIALHPENIRAIMEEMRRTIRDAAPEAEEAIRYGIPTFRLRGRNLVHFAAFSGHIGFYPTPSGIDAFSEELERYETSKGAVRFPLDEPIPYGLVRKMAAYRVKELEGG